jgi:hypothetical protein
MRSRLVNVASDNADSMQSGDFTSWPFDDFIRQGEI